MNYSWWDHPSAGSQVSWDLKPTTPKTPSRPDLKEPPNRTWLGLDKQLPLPPEYYPGHDLEYLDDVEDRWF